MSKRKWDTVNSDSPNRPNGSKLGTPACLKMRAATAAFSYVILPPNTGV